MTCNYYNLVHTFFYIFKGRLNVKNEELDEMLKEAPGPINFTVFLTMFGEKLKGLYFITPTKSL